MPSGNSRATLRPSPGCEMLVHVSLSPAQTIRVGVWNLDSSQPLKARAAQRAWLLQAADVWLLTEVHGAAVEGLDCGCSAPVAGMPGLSWAGVVSGIPVVDRPTSGHPTLALARIAVDSDLEVVFASSVLPWRSAGRYWPAEDPAPYRDRFHSALTQHTRILASLARDGRPVVWGGDFNQELEGPTRAGAADGRTAVLDAFDQLGLEPVSTSADAGEDGSQAIDHIAVPRAWECGRMVRALPESEGRSLSDHPSYVVGVRPPVRT